jgi:hypothetical protein
LKTNTTFTKGLRIKNKNEKNKYQQKKRSTYNFHMRRAKRKGKKKDQPRQTMMSPLTPSYYEEEDLVKLLMTRLNSILCH